jgi:ribonuclease HI
MHAHLDALKNPILSPLDNPHFYANNPSAGIRQRSHQTISTTNRYLVPFPTSIAGNRCYTDASTTPDTTTSNTRQAGLGVFIINMDVQPPISIFIKATMQDSSSIIMAESAALAFAANLLNQFQCRRSTILSDNQQLVHFLNGSNNFNPPDWRIKPYTQIAANILSTTNLQVRRIKRNQNQMTDSLAGQALQALRSNQLAYSSSCTNPSYENDCPVLRAINAVTINSVMVLSASCC